MATTVVESGKLESISTTDKAQTERLEFAHSMHNILKKVTAYSSTRVNSNVANMLERWMNYVLSNNLGGGKLLRGVMVTITFKNLVPNPSQADLERATALGWAIEFMQAASLILDDIMDHSETRRGKPCWYKSPEVGMTAINDAFMVETVAFYLLKVYFGDQPYYKQIYHTVAHILYLTVFGQGMDCLTEKTENILESYTLKRYNAIVKYKTSYYTIYAPIVLGIIMSGKSADNQMMQKIEQIALQIGHYFQVQDDYLDCFGDPVKTGKVGTDIQDNKCSWLFVTATELCDTAQLKFLLENYGKRDPICVGNVKRLYNDLELKEKYHEYEDEIIEDIKNLAFDLQENDGKSFIPPSLFLDLLDKLYKRAE